MDELHLLNFQLKHNDMKNKQYLGKAVCSFFCFPQFFVLQQSGLSHYGAQQVCVLSAEAVALLTFLLPPSCWGLRVGRCQLLFSVTKERRQ